MTEEQAAPEWPESDAVCGDCIFMIANGEICGDPFSEDYEKRTAEVAKATADYALGGAELGFSWTPCASCGCRLGGERFAATYMPRRASK